ncbi:DUF2167 domain-containing protein [Pseudomonas sp. LRF_L74]|uniref:DUF2167 domain-containing protein n=1 Tax=Pseudomonas sp. LRF_L74 TaxID=3369422 RepID=UPI003F5F084E
MSIKDLILAGLLACAMPAAHAATPVASEPEAATAAEEGSEQGEEFDEEAFLDSLNFRTGKIVLGNDLATLNLPADYVFLDGADAERVLTEAWGNPPDEEAPLGMVLPAGISPLEAQSWAVTVEYEESGYVSDEDAASTDYDDMLADLKRETREDNKWRAENGYESVELIGWADKPHYDAEGKKLHWAKEVRFGDSDVNTLNYNIRVLGRKGVLVLNFVAGMDQLQEIKRNVPTVLAMTEFNQGSRYADFNPDMDKVAAYGIGALIAGKVAAKAGLFAMLLVLLKKFWIIPLLIIGWLGKRLGFKKKQPEPQPDPQPAAPASSSALDLNKHEPDQKP